MFFQEVVLISPEKIEEWLKEVEERPASGPAIIQYIANRLSELSARNEELLAENIELRSGRKVEDYENRIANLEYQLEMLKRQVEGKLPAGDSFPGPQFLPTETYSLLVYNSPGKVLRVEMDPAKLVSGSVIASFRGGEAPAENPLQLLATSTRQELLFVFDSGRTQSLPVSAIPGVDPQDLSWQGAYLQEPRGVEELAFLMPIARMALFELVVQASRRGFVKKIKRALLENYLANNYIGSGTTHPLDRTCGMTFSNRDDLFVMVSQEGFVFSTTIERLPFSIEEALRLGMSDHMISAFTVKSGNPPDNNSPSLLAVTQNGKAIHRVVDWLEPAMSFKTHGQSLFSKERRLSGIHIIAADLARKEDWGLALSSDGKVTIHKIADLFGSGSLLSGQAPAEFLGFAVLHIQD
jgi:DNA gyrase/topoisomerase IV subunit A